MKTAIELISEERERQIAKKGYSLSHDDGHENGELAIAACCYAYPRQSLYVDEIRNNEWPFEPESFKPEPMNRTRELVKSGALICAEIERLQRLKNQQNEH